MAGLDLGGGRRVEIAHLGLGHTDGDLVVVIPDADLLFVGDLLESAGPPWYGDDSYPHEWATTADGVIGLMTATTRAIPGHGEPVDRLFTFAQRGEIAGVAGEILRLVEAGVPEAEALARGNWPFPEANIEAGVARGYRALDALGVKGTRPTLPLA
jgi:glyoxylase-like metal-dependent hydrolase (beta-lactamase superfamily II)